MKISKILLATSLVAMSSTAFSSIGGFYIGANTGVAVGKYTTGEQKFKKTRVIAEGVLGYDFNFASCVAGLDFEFGTAFGKIKKTIDDDSVSIKTVWQIGFMPRLGWKVTPDCEIYLAVGPRIVKHKVSTFSSDDNTTATSKKTKTHPVAAIGVRYDLLPNCFVKAEYAHLFKTKAVPGSKYQEHAFKLGVGYRF